MFQLSVGKGRENEIGEIKNVRRGNQECRNDMRIKDTVEGHNKFEVGDLVLVKELLKEWKFAPKFEDSFIVLQELYGEAYVIREVKLNMSLW